MDDQSHEPELSPPEITVLLSGGLDSAACLAFFHSQGFRINALHVNYGQAAAVNEQSAASELAEHFGIPLTTCYWKGCCAKSAGEIVGRNAFLLFAAAMELGASGGLIGAALHAGTPYFDCSKDFLTRTQQILNGYTNGRMRIVAPFLDWSKSDIWQFCNSRSVPVNLTYSCEFGGVPPCGHCLSCRDRKALDAFQDLDNSAQGLGRRA